MVYKNVTIHLKLQLKLRMNVKSAMQNLPIHNIFSSIEKDTTNEKNSFAQYAAMASGVNSYMSNTLRNKIVEAPIALNADFVTVGSRPIQNVAATFPKFTPRLQPK